MKKKTLLGCLALATLSVYAQTEKRDSLQVYGLQEVEILSTRATETTPIAYTNIESKELKTYNTGVDFPYLISMTPSAITTSDAGAGIGYTTLRVRGTDGTRINVTANGIPINDAESHTVFWVNLPDMASSVKDVQIQRGVGTSTNGAGSFGASINLKTTNFAQKPYAEFNASLGSFGTHKETVKVGTGLIKEHWSFDARLSNIESDGYIKRASAELKSYYMQGAWYGEKSSVRLITFSGDEKTYHAWNYASKKDMKLYGRRYNSCGYMFTDENGKDHYYKDQTDNYVQTNYQLLMDHHFNNNWSISGGLHYTKGDGYYQEYKGNRNLIEYGLQPFMLNGEETKKSDLVRKKAMDNHFGGGIFSINYKNDRINTTLGGAYNRYNGDHFGNVLWVKNYIGDLNANHEYYRNKGTKNDGNIFIKADYLLAKGVNVYVDLQYRHIDYKIKGFNDKWNSVSNDGLQRLDVNEHFDFFNPKAGLSWQIDNHNRVFGSFSMAHKEPTRNNYTDGKFTEHPRHETLMDYELGYLFRNSWLHAGANIYYMKYKDQLVLTGELNEIGEAMADNVPDSYRAGIELMGGIETKFGFSWDVNATLSRNKIKNFTEILYEDEDASGTQWKIEHGDTPIAFSPDIIFNNIFGYAYKGISLSLHSQYVGKQYMSNAKQEDCKLDAYFVSNLYMSYTFKLRNIKDITVGFNIYNIFDEEYENNGYAGSGFYFDGAEKVRYNYSGYAAQAGINMMGHISINF
ncbi:MAG: TonB-dependent receptor [Bacteroidaceae bacterium]|nr:TonB-dependent receptor [Bacteroidaceae bacterium]